GNRLPESLDFRYVREPELEFASASSGDARLPRCPSAMAKASAPPGATPGLTFRKFRLTVSHDLPNRRKTMSEIVVHGIPGSPFLRAVLATLQEKGRPYRLRAMG